MLGIACNEAVYFNLGGEKPSNSNVSHLVRIACFVFLLSLKQP